MQNNNLFDGLNLIGKNEDQKNIVLPIQELDVVHKDTKLNLNKDVSKRINLLDGMDRKMITSIAQKAVVKLKQIQTELNDKFYEREDVIRDIIRALVVGEHILLLGPPGTGKSQMSREICDRITGASFFQWLLNRTSDPSELLGPYSIKAMERDEFLRQSRGKLPDADIAFIDEINLGLLGA